MAVIFCNGALWPAERLPLSANDRGLLLGDGVFETLRVYAGKPFALDRHLSLLTAGARALAIPLPDWDIEAAVAETLAGNGLDSANASLRITLTRGPGPRGLLPPSEPEPSLLVSAAPLDDTGTKVPARAIVASLRRNEWSPLSRLKTLNYLENVLARQEAAAAGAEEALLQNIAGRLTGASAANLFLVKEGTLLTPPEVEGLRPGVTRGVVMALAADLGAAVRELPLTLEDLELADEAFLTNSLIEIRPLLTVAGKIVGNEKVGPVTRILQAAYEDAVAAVA